MKKIKLIFFMLFLGLSMAIAQDTTKTLTDDMFSDTEKEQVGNSSSDSQLGKSTIKELTPLSSYEFYLSLIVLGFGAFALLLEVWLIQKKTIDQDSIIKFIVVTIIITATLFLITAGYSNNQIAPALGLLGTIAGYLMGKHESESKKKQDVESNVEPTKIDKTEETK